LLRVFGLVLLNAERKGERGRGEGRGEGRGGRGGGGRWGVGVVGGGRGIDVFLSLSFL